MLHIHPPIKSYPYLSKKKSYSWFPDLWDCLFACLFLELRLDLRLVLRACTTQSYAISFSFSFTFSATIILHLLIQNVYLFSAPTNSFREWHDQRFTISVHLFLSSSVNCIVLNGSLGLRIVNHIYWYIETPEHSNSVSNIIKCFDLL